MTAGRRADRRPPSSILLRGGEVVDGLGTPRRPADVVVGEGRIVSVAPRTGRSEHPAPDGVDDIIDVSGLVVTPGFIDVHTHSDVLSLSSHAGTDLELASVRQGVTLEIVGNCGSTTFPTTAGCHFADQEEFAATLFGPEARVFENVAAFLDAHDTASRVNHLATLSGHSMLRASQVGFEQRAPTDVELHRMASSLAASFEAGAVGWSTGLIYPPGNYAAQSELAALARISARHHVPYVTHLRDEMAHVEAALTEAFEIARASGSALHVSHHKTAGKYSWGRSMRTLAMMDAMRADGLDVSCDVYPYTASNTHLHAMLPPWASEGGVSALLGRLESSDVRDRMHHDIDAGVAGWENTVGNGGWPLIEIATAARHPEAEGQKISDLASAAARRPVDYVSDLLLAENADVTVISRSMDEADLRRILAHPGTMVGSDGIPKTGRPHPRWAGTFARVLGRYVRDLQVLTLEEAVHRMTRLPARRFGLEGRGVLAPGMVADVVGFDPASVSDRATFERPLLHPAGVEHVLVAGTPVVRSGQPTPSRPGQAVRRG